MASQGQRYFQDDRLSCFIRRNEEAIVMPVSYDNLLYYIPLNDTSFELSVF